MATAKNNIPVSAFPLDRTIGEFVVDRQARNLAPKTLQWYTHSLRIFRNYAVENEITSTEAITPHLVRRFLLYLSECVHNAGGVHNIFGALKAYLRWYVDEYAPPNWQNPLNKVKTPKRPQEPLQPIALDDIRALLDTCPQRTLAGDRDRAMILFLLDTGVRHQELVDLSVGDVDLQTGSVLVRCGKGRKPRTVFIGAKIRRALHRYLHHRTDVTDDAPLWMTLQGERLTRGGIREIIRRRAKAAGIKDPAMHTFRRAFAINSLRNGMDLISLQRLMGHTSLVIINKYLALVDDDLRAAH
jgi:integrase/recombinase XerD